MLRETYKALNYPERLATLGICVYEKEYLILRIDRHWKFCPGDWDFVIATFIDKRKKAEENAIMNTKAHTGLNARILKSYPFLRWPDHESRILFVLIPYLMRVERKNFCLSDKFSEVKWVKWKKLLEYDRNEYLTSVTSHINSYGSL